MSAKLFFEWARLGSNQRPAGYEPAALPLSYGPLYCSKRIQFQYTFSIPPRAKRRANRTQEEYQAAEHSRKLRRKEQHRRQWRKRATDPQWKKSHREYKARYQKERLRRAKEGGTCLSCQNLPLPGQVRCERCAERHRESYRKAKARKEALAQQSESEPTISKARQTPEQRREYERERRQSPGRKEYLNRRAREKAREAKEAGKCVTCPNKAIEGQTRCQTCAEKRREYRKRSKEKDRRSRGAAT